MQIKCLLFNQLTTTELYKVIQLREEVFVLEQDCAYQDLDDKDYQAQHLMYWHDDILIAYARLLPRGLSYDGYCAIGRVVVKATHRKSGLGIQLMQDAIARCKSSYKCNIKISAQEYLRQFYTDLGFEQCGEGYLEDLLPHIPMKLIWLPTNA